MTERRAIAIVADLMFRSRIEANAAGTGWRVDVADGPATAAEALARPADLVLVDLHTPGIDIAAVVAAASGAPVVAFGRHTEPATLRAAREAGCAKVLARSEFVEALPALFAAEAPRPGVAR